MDNLIFTYGNLVDQFPGRVIGPARIIDFVDLDENGDMILSENQNKINGFLLELDDLELQEADDLEDEGRYYIRALRDVEYKDRVFQAGVYFKF